MSMKNVKIAVIVLAVLGIGWLFYEYKQIAGEAEVRVAKDIRWLMDGFDEQEQVESLSLQNKTHLETQLVVQGVNEHNRFVRGYHSLFIHSGDRTCLLTEVVYENREPAIQKQHWLGPDDNCLP